MFVERIKSDMKEIAILSDYPLLRSYPALLAAIIGEIDENASEDQSRGFFNAIGGRIAALLPMAEVDDVDLFVDQVNGLWEALGWGTATLELDDEGVDIFHRGLPGSLDGDDAGLWMKVAPAILEGAYDRWFRAMGSADTLKTRLLRASPEVIELRHGL
ncbi:cellulose biosynthesis protein BcsD [Sphingomonas sp. C3-2]|uniref:cellulose biosynthesis protein BcsD n=1 Tax=Sphingomonas sp. C3-2 TaxID=3062169 RepID=UPI00294AC223|nr:cellulose biosynthesis protein BcsD [Sphingomonas sp. C3-2]WOK35986.1 cellulose biosynthesis protein BcsD [Sphingomonas sp. C3-2]